MFLYAFLDIVDLLLGLLIPFFFLAFILAYSPFLFDILSPYKDITVAPLVETVSVPTSPEA